MKTSMLIALMTEGFSLVSVRFRQQGGGKSAKTYHYKYPGTDVEAGDMVVVESPHEGFVIVDVESVDTDPVLDTNAGFSYKWVVQKVDTTEYYAHKEREMGLTKHLRRLQNRAEAERTLATIRDELKGTNAGQEFEELVAQLDLRAKRPVANEIPGPPQMPPQQQPMAPTVQNPHHETVNGVKFSFWVRKDGPTAGAWAFARFGDLHTHHGFSSLDGARKMARHMVNVGAIK